MEGTCVCQCGNSAYLPKKRKEMGRCACAHLLSEKTYMLLMTYAADRAYVTTHISQKMLSPFTAQCRTPQPFSSYPFSLRCEIWDVGIFLDFGFHISATEFGERNAESISNKISSMSSDPLSAHSRGHALRGPASVADALFWVYQLLFASLLTLRGLDFRCPCSEDPLMFCIADSGSVI